MPLWSSLPHLNLPSRRAELWEVTVYARGAVQSYPPLWMYDKYLLTIWFNSTVKAELICTFYNHDTDVPGWAISPISISLEELPVLLINMLIKTCIKEKTHFHIPSVLYDHRMDQRENASPHSCFSFHSWFRGQKWLTRGNTTDNEKSTKGQNPTWAQGSWVFRLFPRMHLHGEKNVSSFT